MNDEYANHLPQAHTSHVPGWAKRVNPHGQAVVIGPPPNDPTGEIRSVEMLVVDDERFGRVFYGYIRIPKEAAQEMADADGGWVEVGFCTPQLIPWSNLVYSALDTERTDRARTDRPENP